MTFGHFACHLISAKLLFDMTARICTYVLLKFNTAVEKHRIKKGKFHPANRKRINLNMAQLLSCTGQINIIKNKVELTAFFEPICCRTHLVEKPFSLMTKKGKLSKNLLKKVPIFC
jgi:hypothetical protein